MARLLFLRLLRGKEENAGCDAFVPLINSGISAYFWSSGKFFSIMTYIAVATEVRTQLV